MLELIFASHWYWLIAAALLLILEIIIPGIFLIWLGLGAALVGLFLLLAPGADPAWQLLALAVSICIAVAAGLKWQKKLLHRQPQSLNLGLEGFIGRSARVSQAFVHGQGRVYLEDSTYAAVCNSAALSEGLPVVVTAVDGGLLVVEPERATPPPASH